MSAKPAIEEEKEPLDARIIIPVSASLLSEIEDYRFGERFKSQSAAVRKLIELGLQAEKKRLKR